MPPLSVYYAMFNPITFFRLRNFRAMSQQLPAKDQAMQGRVDSEEKHMEINNKYGHTQPYLNLKMLGIVYLVVIFMLICSSLYGTTMIECPIFDPGKGLGRSPQVGAKKFLPKNTGIE